MKTGRLPDHVAEARRARVRDMLADNAPPKVIAAECGVSATNISKFINKLGYHMRYVTDAEFQTILADRRAKRDFTKQNAA